jgi:hypothetical protein
MAELDANRGGFHETACDIEILADSRMSATAPLTLLASCCLLMLTGKEAATADAVIARRIYRSSTSRSTRRNHSRKSRPRSRASFPNWIPRSAWRWRMATNSVRRSSSGAPSFSSS